MLTATQTPGDRKLADDISEDDLRYLAELQKLWLLVGGGGGHFSVPYIPQGEPKLVMIGDQRLRWLGSVFSDPAGLFPDCPGAFP